MGTASLLTARREPGAPESIANVSSWDCGDANRRAAPPELIAALLKAFGTGILESLRGEVVVSVSDELEPSRTAARWREATGGSMFGGTVLPVHFSVAIWNKRGYVWYAVVRMSVESEL